MENLSFDSSTQPVFFDHDGGIDDFVAMVLLLTQKNLRLTGVSVVNGDCLVDEAVDTTMRILYRFGHTEIEIAKGSAKPVHPFPMNWRVKPSIANMLKELSVPRNAGTSPISFWDASDFMAQKIMDEEQKTTILMTGPASNVAKAIKNHPEICTKIERIVWMGGTVNHSGNVSQPMFDGSAEWNVFWDPVSAQELIKSEIPLQMFPLDVCSCVPIDASFMSDLETLSEKHELCRLVFRLYQIVHLHENYYMWDVLPAAYLGNKNLFELQSVKLDVELQGASSGRTFVSPTGSEIQYASSIDKKSFYDYFFQQLSNWE